MSVYVYKVVRWPFDVQAPNNSFSFEEDGVGPPTSVQTVTVGTYINDGSASVIAPKDFVKAFKDAANLAITALGLGGSMTAVLNADGKMVLTWTGQTGGDLLLTGLTATQQMWLGISTSSFSFFDGVNTLDFQAGCQWHPGIDDDHDSGNLGRQLASEGKNLLGQPRRVVRSAARWEQRRIAWSFIASARMLDARAAESGFATFAGLTVGEDNTWENMWEYLLGEPGPYGDNRVYIYSTNDPATDTVSGPYDVILSESNPGLDGVPAGGVVGGMAIEHFPCMIMLREI